MISTSGLNLQKVDIFPMGTIIDVVKKTSPQGEKVVIQYYPITSGVMQYYPDFDWKDVVTPACSGINSLIAKIKAYNLPMTNPITFTAVPGQTTYQLPNPMIMMGTTKYLIVIDKMIAEQSDFTIDIAGVITFGTSFTGGESVQCYALTSW